MCTSGSDFDVAVVVEPGHIFTQKPELWRKYQATLSKADLGFKVDPRLVVESPLQTRYRLFELVPERNRDDNFTQYILAKMKELLKDNE